MIATASAAVSLTLQRSLIPAIVHSRQSRGGGAFVGTSYRLTASTNNACLGFNEMHDQTDQGEQGEQEGIVHLRLQPSDNSIAPPATFREEISGKSNRVARYRQSSCRRGQAAPLPFLQLRDAVWSYAP